jgi:redox-sensitive bicupin YhaK (pirin superfamily)
VAEGTIGIDDHRYGVGLMAIGCPHKVVTITATTDSRIMVIGGEPLGERFISWNFVSSSRARIEQAREDWAQRRFPAVPGDNGHIPLPD